MRYQWGHRVSAAIVLWMLGSSSVVAQASRPPVAAVLGVFDADLTILADGLTDQTTRTIGGVRFVSGLFGDRNVVLVRCGVGKVNAAVSATLVVEHFRPEGVVFTGTAGGINPELGPGDVVIGAKTAQHDYGQLSGARFLSRPTRHPLTQERNPFYFLADEELVAAAEKAAQGLKLKSVDGRPDRRAPKVVSGVIVTGDTFIAALEKKRELRTMYQADAAEMEGAAVAQVCWQRNVPCLVIRGLSDGADAEAGDDFRRFSGVAAENSAALVRRMIANLE
jgi:adenosylhomocysteine nucleosidase